jgi:imidazolonepropionase-like amidohydrolase
MNRSHIPAFLLCCFPALSLAQDLGIKAPPQSQPILITGATLHPVSSPAIPDGHILFNAGRIETLGGGPAPKAGGDVKVIDAAGVHIYPGLISGYTQLGLIEIGMVRASNDTAEVGSAGISPEVRAVVAVNPDSNFFPVTRFAGILAAGVFPTGGVIPGRAGVIKLDGWTWEEMSARADAGLVVNWPQSRPITAWWMDQSEDDQLKNIRQNMQRIEDAFNAAASYLASRAADPSLPTDVRWEAMRRVFDNSASSAAPAQLPVFFLAQDYDQIISAVEFAIRRALRPVIVGGRDAPLCAELLKRHNVPVIVLGTFRMPRRDDSPYDDGYSLPRRLEEAGIKWCLANGDSTPHERNLPFAAAMAVAHGLDHDAAIRALTLSAAEILGVADSLGSLEPGKSATLIVTDGDPLELSTTVQQAFIDGRQIDLSNKHTELNRKYREKYRQRR